MTAELVHGARRRTFYAGALVAFAAAGLMNVGTSALGWLFSSVTVADLGDEFGASAETRAAGQAALGHTFVPILVGGAIVAAVAGWGLYRLAKSGRPVRWALAAPVGVALSFLVAVALSWSGVTIWGTGASVELM